MKNLSFYGARAAAVTPSDTVTFGPSIIYVGGAGTITIRDLGGNQVQFTVPAGATLPAMASAVMLTGTTATLIVRAF